MIATFEREEIGYNRYLPSIHLQPYMRERYGFREGLCPVAEDVSSRSLALPFFNGLEAWRTGARRGSSRVRAVNLASLGRAEPFATKDGSTIRELHHTSAQSLAGSRARAGSGDRAPLPRADRGDLPRDEGVGRARGRRRNAHRPSGDAILIPPGAWHTLENDGTSELLIICMCVPPYSHEDTFFE